jgi:multidrug resistance efflux pump
MKLHYLLLFTLHLSLFSTPSVLTAQNCQDYTCNIAKARTALSHKKFKEAIDYCKAAKAYPNAHIAEADAVIYQIFVAIEKEKEEAKKARDEANRQRDIAKNALAQVEIEFDRHRLSNSI